MFIPEREIWLKATAQAMVDLTRYTTTEYLPPTIHAGCPNTSV